MKWDTGLGGRRRDRALKLACLMGLAMAVAASGCAAAPADRCSSQLHPDAVIADERFGAGVVSFVRVPYVVGTEGGKEVIGNEIQVLRFRDGSGCAAEQVAMYGYGGGEPVLEESFIHSVQGEPNLFAIVSWPHSHAGLGMHGRIYSVHAYHEVDGALVTNRVVAGSRELSGGVEGTLEGGIPSTFEGETRQGVIGMLQRLGLE